MRPTYHVVPAATWAGRDHRAPYVAPSLADEGFIHCTDGADELVATANRHYRGDPSAYLALTIDLDAAGSMWRIEDPSGIYPHVYGPIAPDAIVAVAEMQRAPDGRFTVLVDRA
jgi:uncharacterized protein (DUF952 family)